MRRVIMLMCMPGVEARPTWLLAPTPTKFGSDAVSNSD
jgi:hypothetical protein